MSPSLTISAGSLTVIALAVVVEHSGGSRGDQAALAPAGDEILERVVARGRDPEAAELTRLRAQLARAPGDETLAARYARLALTAARRRGDPRYLGQAEAALAPWWQSAAPPEEIHLLRATLRQSGHDFSGALADLDALLARAPDHEQALLTRAVVLGVLGRHDDAATSCRRLPPGTSTLVRAACAAPSEVARARGPAAIARALRPLAAADPTADPREQAWALSLLGELRFWSGSTAGAEADLRRALSLDPGDRYTRGLYADLLLDAGRNVEVRELLAGREEDDALLLRLAVAEHRLGGPRAAELSRGLREAFSAARSRGDQSHLREEARFTLEVLGDARRALDLALTGWRVQREPWDARLVLESARAAGQPERAVSVADFVEERAPGWAALTTATRLALSRRRAP